MLDWHVAWWGKPSVLSQVGAWQHATLRNTLINLIAQIFRGFHMLQLCMPFYAQVYHAHYSDSMFMCTRHVILGCTCHQNFAVELTAMIPFADNYKLKINVF